MTCRPSGWIPFPALTRSADSSFTLASLGQVSAARIAVKLLSSSLTGTVTLVTLLWGGICLENLPIGPAIVPRITNKRAGLSVE